MPFKFTPKGISALQWIVSKLDDLKKLLADYPRLANKVDTLKGGGDVAVTNPPSGSIVVSSVASKRGGIPATSAAPVIVKITSAASGGGKYNGRIWLAPTVAISASGTLAATDLGTDPGSDNALVLNNEELGQATHDLTGGTVKVQFFVGIVRGATSAGLPVVVINGVDWESCT